MKRKYGKTKKTGKKGGDLSSMFSNVSNQVSSSSWWPTINLFKKKEEYVPYTPNAMQPNAMQPNAMQPNAMQPNVMQPNVMQPNTMQPNVVKQPIITSTGGKIKRKGKNTKKVRWGGVNYEVMPVQSSLYSDAFPIAYYKTAQPHTWVGGKKTKKRKQGNKKTRKQGNKKTRK
jgi:hypothetical protein